MRLGTRTSWGGVAGRSAPYALVKPGIPDPGLALTRPRSRTGFPSLSVRLILRCHLPLDGTSGHTSAQHAGLQTGPLTDLDSSLIREWPADLQCEEEHAVQLQAEWEAGRAAWQTEWDAQSLPPFVAASTYQPPPPGFVFKLGGKGLGFYRDAPPVLPLHTLLHGPATQVAPLQLRLNQLVPGPARSLPEQTAARSRSALEEERAAEQRAYEAAAFSRLRPKQQTALLSNAARASA